LQSWPCDYHLVAHIAKGLPFLNRETSQTGVLILALEEHGWDVRNRLRELGAEGLDNVYVQFGRLDQSKLADVKDFIVENGIGLIVIDTLAAYWPVTDENNAAQVGAAVNLLLDLARETDACVLMIHHCRKADGSDGDEIRGSGALFAAVDIAIVCKGGDTLTQRVLTAAGRYSADTPKSLVIDLTDDGYEVKGDTVTAMRESVRQKVLDAFVGIETVCGLVAKTGLKDKKVRDCLRHWRKKGKVVLLNEGVKGNPAQYQLAGSH
jgi:predicted ATP-dependent serine protease